MSDSEPQSRTRLIQWAAALLLPNLILACWWFRQVSPFQYLAQVYSLDLPTALRLPAIGIMVSAIAAVVARKWMDERREQSVARGVSPVIAVTLITVSMALCAGIIFGAGFLLNIVYAVIGKVILLAAISFGLCALDLLRLKKERFDSPVERLVLAAALGLGAFALLMFIGGSLSLLNTWIWWLFLLLILVAGALPMRGLLADLQVYARETATKAHPVTLALFCFIALWFFAHALLIWSPPLEYDILEYHLGAPAEYLRSGRISFLHHNIYATMPENGEMLFMLGMVLSGSKTAGLPAAHVVLFGAWMLTIYGVYALATRIVRRLNPDESDGSAGPALGAALLAITPVATQVVADFYVEHIQSLFHLGALMATCAFLDDQRTRAAKRFDWLLLAGMLAGFACGTKYPAMLFTVFPLLALLPLFCWHAGSLFDGVRAALTVGAPSLVMFSPWLLRNLLAADDPIYPLGLVLKRRAEGQAAADHLTHFDIATRAGERSLGAFAKVLRNLWPGFQPASANEQPLKRFLVDAEASPALLFFAIPGLLRAIRPEVLFVAAFFVLDVIVWFLFTYRLNRFFYTLLGPLAVIAAVGAAQVWIFQPLRKAVVALCIAGVLVFAPLSMIYVWLLSVPARVTAVESLDESASAQFNAYGTGQWFKAWQAINALPEKSRVLFIGDAQTFYLERTPEFSVVFNPQLLEEILPASRNGSHAAESVLARGITHVYISYSEWFRLDTSYAVTRPSPEADWQQMKWNDAQRNQMRELLSSGRYAEYRRSWPSSAEPAYLKLNVGDYAKLEELMRKFTVIEQAWPNSVGQPSCELRRLVPAQ